jgi:hypothetical protein
MPGLKLSESHRKIYGGLRGKQLLLDSINFLFAIKGKEFHKQNPSFITPDATEFIAYSHIVNRNIVGKVSKDVNKNMDHFIKFICGDVIQGSGSFVALMRCIYLTMLALGSYSVTEYILMGADELSRAYISAFEWYTSQVVTCINSSRDTVLGTIEKYVDNNYFSQLPTIIKNFSTTEDVSAVAIGSYVIGELQHVADIRMFDYVIQMPYAAVLYKKGFKETCKGFVADLYERFSSIK